MNAVAKRISSLLAWLAGFRCQHRAFYRDATGLLHCVDCGRKIR